MSILSLRPLTSTTQSRRGGERGFALIASLSIMAMLVMIGIALYSLASVATRSAEVASARTQSQANAKMALMVALGELQLEMGPDMRISAEAAIHDTDPSTEAIEGVAQPHWMATYDSWGNWLNGEYTPEGKLASEVSSISDTYGPKRASMFRRWLVSLPEEMKNDVESAVSPLREDDEVDDWVIMVGEGTLGSAHVAANPEKVTRAYLMSASDRSNYAWWVSPENHKAKIGLAAQEREQNGVLSADEWATAQGVSSEVAIGAIDGLESLDTSNAGAAENAGRVINLGSLPLVGVDGIKAQEMFFDLTDASAGVLSNTRSGGLKKDLSLLFENSDTTIAPQYTQADRFAPEPSIRPHSKDVLAENAVLPRRPFASWPNMRHYYRMYREDTDTPYPPKGPMAQTNRNLNFTDGRPSTGIVSPWNIRDSDKDERWFGENSYLRYPMLARFLLIHAYRTERYYEERSDAEEVAFHYYDIPVMTLWNPYSTPLTFESGQFGVQVAAPHAWPNKLQMYNLDGSKDGSGQWSARINSAVPIKTEDGSDIVFQPGEFKTFSCKPGVYLANRDENLDQNPDYGLFEGFNPNATGGLTDGGPKWWKRVSDNGVFNERDFEVTFDRAKGENNNTRNTQEGNAPGSLTVKMGFGGDPADDGVPSHYQIDWFQNSQLYQSITRDEFGGLMPLIETEDPLPVGYSLLTLKTTNRVEMPASWARDWRSRNWLHAPPYNFGGGLYMTEHSETRAHTQRLDSAYEVSFGPTSPSELIKLTGEIDGKPWLGFGSNPFEKVTAVPAIELPSAPTSSLASFSGMRVTPGWIWSQDLNPDWHVRQRTGRLDRDSGRPPVSLYNAYAKQYAYQSGITAGGIGNSFVHPMIPRDEVYFYHDNSKSLEHADMLLTAYDSDRPGLDSMEAIETKAYSDYWDHGLVLNDALWDEYFISSIADQTRPWASEADNLEANIDSLTAGDGLPVSRYQYHDGGLDAAEVKDKLNEDDGYLMAAEHLTVDGAFNVNSTSVNAWYALFKGIRERKLHYRDSSSGELKEVDVPDGHVALSRFDTPTTDQETSDLSSGVVREDGHMVWSGVRFLDDDQIRLLAEKCVEQVKRRGPFLNFSEFINRRLENSELGLMGALQSAIDFDDESPDSSSINYLYKRSSGLMMDESDLGDHEYQSPEAVNGSRFAGIPGYLIQSDVLKPISNTLAVRDDTFRIRAYGETIDAEGNVIARAWCEAVIQRVPEYLNSSDDPHEPAYMYEAEPPDDTYDPHWDGEFVRNNELSETNQRFGRKFIIKSFRWLNSDEV